MHSQENMNGKRSMILRVATDLFSRYPYHKVAMDSIAKKANVAKGTLYYHFNSKEELYASLLHEGVDEMLQKLNAQPGNTTPEEKLKRILRELILFFHENRAFFVVLHQEEIRLLTKKLKNCYRKICTVKDLLVSTIKEGIEKGAFRTVSKPELLAEMILGMIKVPVTKGIYDKQHHSEIATEILLNGLNWR